MKDLEERRLGLGSGYCCLEGFASNCCESPAGSRAEKEMGSDEGVYILELQKTTEAKKK